MQRTRASGIFISVKLEEENGDDKNTVYLPRQYMPQPDGGVFHERHCASRGLEKRFEIASAATSREEIGNDVYPPARRTLVEHGISCPRRAARQLTRADFEEYDLIIGMDSENERGMRRICGDGDAEKIHLLMDYTDHPGDVADPWYTEDFEATWQDVLVGCQGLLRELMEEMKKC